MKNKSVGKRRKRKSKPKITPSSKVLPRSDVAEMDSQIASEKDPLSCAEMIIEASETCAERNSMELIESNCPKKTRKKKKINTDGCFNCDSPYQEGNAWVFVNESVNTWLCHECF